jgi:uncharacterized protein
VTWRFDPRVDRAYTKAEMDALPEPAREFIEIRAFWNKATGLWIFCGDNAKYMNHSKNPTTETVNRGKITDDIAARDLPANTELTCNYHHFYDNKDVLERMGLRE